MWIVALITFFFVGGVQKKFFGEMFIFFLNFTVTLIIILTNVTTITTVIDVTTVTTITSFCCGNLWGLEVVGQRGKGELVHKE